MNQEKLRIEMIALFEETVGNRIQRKSYTTEIEQLKSSYQTLFEEIIVAVDESEDNLEIIADFLPEYASRQLNALPSKRKRGIATIDYNMNMVAFFLPLIGELHALQAKPLVEKIVEKWNEKMPDTKIGASTVDGIAGGFKKGLCYISTAVCSSLQKPDDCYELSLLRQYRDTYLLNSKEGNAVIEEYYNIAPTIVKRINQQADSALTYRRIWQDYLSPCVRLIEEQKHEECKGLYCDMVRKLEREYVH